MIIRVNRIDRTGRNLDHREAAKRIGRTATYRGSKPDYFIFETPDPTSCAICVNGDGPFRLTQLEPGGPLYAVCRECDQGAIVEKVGPRLYDPPELPTFFTQKVSRAHKRIARGRDYHPHRARLVQYDERTPNAILIRVPVHDENGKPRDMREACATFAHESWATTTRYLGYQTDFHIFERPDPEFARKSRQIDHRVLEALASLTGAKR